MAQAAKVTPIKPAFVIETGVPMPKPINRNPGAGGADAMRSLAKAAIGASVFIPQGTYSVENGAAVAAARAGGRGWYTCRKVDGGMRVWKIAEPTPRA